MPPLLAGLLVFGTAAATLVLEILAGRLLAPFVGVTLETYTGIIGTVLAGISLGTWLGGRAADRVDPRRLLGPLLLACGGLTLFVVPLIEWAAGLGLAPDPTGIVTFAAIAFFAPAAVLSAVTPTVVKLQLHDLRETGSVVGRLSALATAGAIAGTFVTGFVLVAAMPSRPIVVGLGVVLVLAGLVLALTLGRASVGSAAAVAILLIVSGGAWSAATAARCQVESAYYCIRVEVDPLRDGGRTLLLDDLRHSYVDLDDPVHLEFSYARAVAAVADAVAPTGTPIRTLHVGGGGFTLPRYLAATRPGATSHVLELDAVVVRIAREQLDLEVSDALTVETGDARSAIARQPDAAYDLVIGDAFGGLAVPWHLATKEMVEEVERVLDGGGIYVVNLIDYPPLDFARAELRTMAAVFDHAGFLAPDARIRGLQGGNLILLGSNAPIPTDAILAGIAQRRGPEALVWDGGSTVPGVTLDSVIGDSLLLTDDFAPVDQLLSLPE